MFIRIMQLGIALYYGEIGNFKDGDSEDLICHSKDTLGSTTGKYHSYFLKRNVKSINLFTLYKYKWPSLVIVKCVGSLQFVRGSSWGWVSMQCSNIFFMLFSKKYSHGLN